MAQIPYWARGGCLNASCVLSRVPTMAAPPTYSLAGLKCYQRPCVGLQKVAGDVHDVRTAFDEVGLRCMHGADGLWFDGSHAGVTPPWPVARHDG